MPSSKKARVVELEPDRDAVGPKERAFGRYELLRRIAFGGMGEVFLARLSGPAGVGFTKIVVIKRILSHVRHDPKHVKMFLDEAKLQALLADPRIVQVYDMGQVDEHVFLAMEWVDGPSWKAVVDKARSRGEVVHAAHVVELMTQACTGLGYAHNLVDASGRPLGIVHRDVNPHNLLVTYDGAVKIIDFGIAKSELSEGKTETGTIKGKFAYMSPEQAAAEPVDRRSDVFALGICLYEMLAGDNPFRRTNIVLSLEAVQMIDPPPITAARPDCEALQPILERALAKRADDRFADCSELGAALRALVDDGVIPPAPEPLAAWLQRAFQDEMAAQAALMQQTGGGAVVRSGPVPPVRAGKSAATTAAPSAAARARTSADAPPVSLDPSELVSFEGARDDVIDTRTFAPLPSVTDAGAVFRDDPTAPQEAAVSRPPSEDGPPTSAGARPLDEEPRRRRGASPLVVGAAAAATVLLTATATALAFPTTRALLLGTAPAAVAEAAPPRSTTTVPATTTTTTTTPRAEPVALVADEAAPPAAPADVLPAADDDAPPPTDAPASSPAAAPPPSTAPAKPAAAKKQAPPAKRVDRVVGVLAVVGGPRVKVVEGATRLVTIPGAITVALRVAGDGERARVVVDAEPWAVLRVDNVGRGRTPISDVVVPAGRKVDLSLSSPRADGAVSLSLTYRPE